MSTDRPTPSTGAVTGRRSLVAAMWDRWTSVLVSVLGLLQVLMALTATPRWIAVIGIVGGLGVVVAAWIPDPRRRRLLLVAGAAPFAVLTWWGLVAPLVAVLALVLGWRRRR